MDQRLKSKWRDFKTGRKNFKVFTIAVDHCCHCGSKINTKRLGIWACIYLLDTFNILCDPRNSRYCQQCGNKIFDKIDEMFKKNENIEEITYNDIKKNKKLYYRYSQRYLNTIVSLSLNPYMVEYVYKKQPAKKLDAVALEKFRGRGSRNFYKKDIGFEYEMFIKIIDEILKHMPNTENITRFIPVDIPPNKCKYHTKGQRIYDEKYEYAYKWNKKKDMNVIKKSVYLWLAFMYKGLPLNRLEPIYGYDRTTLSKYLYMGSSLLNTYFKPFHLCNTREKIKKEQNLWIHQMLGISYCRNIVFIDGIRFKCKKSKDFAAQYYTFSKKDKFNAINMIGVFTFSGQCIGFFPESGNFSSKMNGDGYLWDRILMHNEGGITNLLPTNDPFLLLTTNIETGAVIFADKAWHLSQDKIERGHKYYTPNCDGQKKPENRQAANYGRICTMFRFSIEHSFGAFTKLWKFYTNFISTSYALATPYWINICGSIINFTKYGYKTISDERIKQIAYMNMREQYGCDATSLLLRKILFDWKSPTSIKKGTYLYDNKYIKVWKKAKGFHDILNDPYNKFWDMNMIKLFNTNNYERKFMAGGIYGINNAPGYLWHSRNKIEIYYSTMRQYEHMIMVRSLMKKYSCELQAPNGNEEVTHHVLLVPRTGDEIIINTDVACGIDEYQQPIYKYMELPAKILTIKSVCLCRHGLRDRSICGHQTAAFLYYHLWFMSAKTGRTFKLRNPKVVAQRRMHMMKTCKKFQKEMRKLNKYERECSWAAYRLLYRH